MGTVLTTSATSYTTGDSYFRLPAYGDGPFWASHITALGTCAATINQHKLTPGRLAQAMRVAVGDTRLRDNARRLGTLVSAENGAAQVISAINTLV
ncbi:UDP:flavonoid glycosyltransferase YjiC (YdhE family) [Mycobacterium sp. MAA66]|uniref:hypothetical protein n=1 Tax=Mycobacterium sp. MAA66 TaxID=3156297 RepID=UPI00351973AB